MYEFLLHSGFSVLIFPLGKIAVLKGLLDPLGENPSVGDDDEQAMISRMPM